MKTGRVARCRKTAARIRRVAETTRIRDYQAGDAPEIARLFYETVRSVSRADYSDEQVEAWAPGVPDPEEWHARMAGRRTLVAEEGGVVAGFAELEGDGHLDMLYLRKDAVCRGVGRMLYRTVEREARGLGLGQIFTEASITAPSSSTTGSAWCASRRSRCGACRCRTLRWRSRS